MASETSSQDRNGIKVIARAALCEELMLMSTGPHVGYTLEPSLFKLAASANIETDRIARPVM